MATSSIYVALEYFSLFCHIGHILKANLFDMQFDITCTGIFTQYIQSDISKASPKHYFRDVFRVQISSEEQPVCNSLLP